MAQVPIKTKNSPAKIGEAAGEQKKVVRQGEQPDDLTLLL